MINFDLRKVNLNNRKSVKRSSKKGVSMLISLGLVFVIMFFSLIVGNVVVSSIRQSSNVNRANEAYFAAEGALEQGLLANYEQGAGYTSDVEDAGYTGVDATYEIQGQVPEDVKYGANSAYDGMYGIPTPGTGNVGKNCDPLNPVINAPFEYGGSSYEAANHPCNWNKIKTGETVAIPLYYTDPLTEKAVNLFTDNNQELYLRVRTPCADGSDYCSATSRYTFNYWYDGVGNEPDDDALINWQVSAFDAINKINVTLSAKTKYYDDNNEFELGSYNTSLVSEYLFTSMTNSNNSIMLNIQSTKGIDLNLCEGPIINFLVEQHAPKPGCSTANQWDQNTIEKPTLKFSIISSLRNDTGSNIPYLEYQVLSSPSIGALPTDYNQTITAEGISGTFKQVLEVKQPQEGGLPEYVVQQ